MTKQEFIEQLTKLLSDVPKADQEEAIQYYEEYFEEAGFRDTEDVLERVDNPEKIACSIKKGLAQSEDGEFDENGYHDLDRENELMRNSEVGKRRKDDRNYYKEKKGKHRFSFRNLDRSQAILLAIILCLTFPFWGGILGGLLGAVIGIVAAVFGIAVAAVAVSISLLVAGVAVIVAGISVIPVAPMAALICVGIGCILFGIGIIALDFVVWGIRDVIPYFWKLCKKLWKRLFGEEKEVIS